MTVLVLVLVEIAIGALFALFLLGLLREVQQIRLTLLRRYDVPTTITAENTLGEVEETPAEDPPIFVVAANLREADYWRHLHHLPRRGVRYVSGLDSLIGARGARIVFYGNWQDRPDANELWEYANAGGNTVVAE